MRKSMLFPVLLLAAWVGSNCNCSDSLGLAVGEIELALCDRGEACGCGILEAEAAVIDFGSPSDTGVSRRILRVRNLNKPRKLTVTRIEISDGDNVFGVTGIQKLSAEIDPEEVSSHNMDDGPLVLQDDEIADIFLAFQPGSVGSFQGTLLLTSDSPTRPVWEIALTGGGGDSDVCVIDGACGDGSVADFGTFTDDQVGPDLDDPLGRPLALGTQMVTVTNNGSTEAFVRVELTDDGVPETRPNELPGENGVFFLNPLGCSVVEPGGSLDIPVDYRPFSAGEHIGELSLSGVGGTVHIQLIGRVTGAHICFRTEDDVPQDSVLVFGDPPTYSTPSNASPELRRIWAGNCGFQEDLIISDVTPTATLSPMFSTTALPWSQTGALAPGAEIEIPVTLTPNNTPGTSAGGRYIFYTNDRVRPNGAGVEVSARLGPPEVCLLTISPSPVDFGWIASDDEGQGCDPAAPFCPPGQDIMVSRAIGIRLVNGGQRACTNISIGPILADSASTDLFTIESNPNGSGFTLNPGESSQEITLMFAKVASDTPANHFAKLEYRSPDIAVVGLDPTCAADAACVDMKSKAGGSPSCNITFRPVSPPTLFCPSETVGFGNVNIGQDKTIDVQLVNTGSEECIVQNIRPKSGTSSAFTFPTVPFRIPVNDYQVIPVTFSPIPPTGGIFEDLPFLCGQNGMQMDANTGTAGATQTEGIDFSGKGTRPDIDVIPGEIDFGEVTVGCCSAEQRVAIYNSGDGTLTINAIGVLGGTASDFSISQNAGDMELTPGESTEFYVRYCATSEGEITDLVEIESTDDNEELFTVSMTGTGTLSNEGRDEFEQPDRPKVDVLWVVDDSGSMSDEQDDLANNFSSFISQAVSLDTDYHIGVTNTDGETEWSGRLYSCSGNPKWIKDTQPQAQQDAQFRCNVKVSDPDDGRPSTDSKESALQAARAAFEYPNLDDWNTMSGGHCGADPSPCRFIRDDAKLYVVLVTDEDDQSDGEADMYVDFFRNLKGLGNPDLLNISAITGPPPDGCDTAEANQKGYDAVQAVGGQFRSICAADWTDLIGSLGLDVFNARRQFPLSRPATAATIQVHKCSAPCPANPDDWAGCPLVSQDATNGWTYDGTVNAVGFNGSSIPGASECIYIEYIAFCFQP